MTTLESRDSGGDPGSQLFSCMNGSILVGLPTRCTYTSLLSLSLFISSSCIFFSSFLFADLRPLQYIYTYKSLSVFSLILCFFTYILSLPFLCDAIVRVILVVVIPLHSLCIISLYAYLIYNSHS